MRHFCFKGGIIARPHLGQARVEVARRQRVERGLIGLRQF